MSVLSDLCREHTQLAASDIERLTAIANTLQFSADLMRADLFIDCLTSQADVAIVVAQARPAAVPSLYQRSVVGEFAYRQNEPAALRTLNTGLPTTGMLAKTQENRDVRQNVTPIKNASGVVIGVVIAESDITDHIKTEKTLSLLSQTTRQLAEDLISTRRQDHGLPYHVRDGIVMFDVDGTCTYANPVAREIYRKLGCIDDIEGLDFISVALGDTRLEDVLEKKQIDSCDVKVGNLVLNVKYSIMKDSEFETAGVVMLTRDETDAKAKEKELILKSVAIKEIHHRVKNNLQTIASLLRLQARRIENDIAKTALSESISRVLSIAATHEILAQNGVDDVALKTMLHRIKNFVLGHGVVAGKDIEIHINGDDFLTHSDVATSIALVVNEVIQNSLKHAFVDRKQGRIAIALQQGATHATISITDDGVGYDPTLERDPSSLGGIIVRQIVVDKLKGNLTIQSTSKGTTVFFDFPLEEEAVVT